MSRTGRRCRPKRPPVFVGCCDIASRRKGIDTDVWVVDVERQSFERLTHGGDHAAPLWTVQGDTVTYGQSLPDSIGIAVRRADGSGEPTILREDGSENWPMSWSPDGLTLAFEKRGQGGERDIWTMRPGEANSARKLAGTVFSEESPRISPNGRWLAFVSDKTGVYEVYVASYPALDRRWQISSGGGSEPVWGPGGDELFYRTAWQVLAVPLPEEGGVLNPGLPAPLFEGFFNRSQLGHAHFDVAPDGEKFVMVEEPGEAFELLRLVQGWDRELRELVPK